jgi:protein-S-isoprenylcysteine O-methyltransferase Ste14
MYLGLALVYLGIATAGQCVWALILLPVVLIIIQRGAIEPEEAFLEKRFGVDYIFEISGVDHDAQRYAHRFRNRRLP